jgi:MoaA/NifB/PqqE/SkfB family radical SAM enzyme
MSKSKSVKLTRSKQPRFLHALGRSLRRRLALSWPAVAKPGKLRLAVTRKCNSQCKMCNVWRSNGNNPQRQELSLDEYEKIFTENRDYFSRLNHISLTGGEPTLRPDLLELLQLICHYHPGVAINLNTNAFYDEPLMKFVEQAVKLTRRLTLMVSLDGLGAAHDEVRGVPGAFARTFRSLEALMEFRQAGGKIKLSINHIFTPDNYRDFEKVLEFCRQNYLALTPIVMQQGTSFDNDGLNLSLNETATAELVVAFEKIMAEEGYTATLKDIEVLAQLKGAPRDYRCWAGKVLVLIDEQGEVYPSAGCPSDWSFGNLRQQNFDIGGILRTKQAAQVFKKVKECRNCRLACEMLTTLRGPEALAGYGKLRSYAQANNHRSA